jgi:hypothetical protein
MLDRDDPGDRRKGVTVNEGLGARFWLRLIGLTILLGIGMLLLFLLIDAAWYRWGIFGALIFFFLLFLLFGWIYDRRHAREYADLET